MTGQHRTSQSKSLQSLVSMRFPRVSSTGQRGTRRLPVARKSPHFGKWVANGAAREECRRPGAGALHAWRARPRAQTRANAVPGGAPCVPHRPLVRGEARSRKEKRVRFSGIIRLA